MLDIRCRFFREVQQFSAKRAGHVVPAIGDDIDRYQFSGEDSGLHDRLVGISSHFLGSRVTVIGFLFALGSCRHLLQKLDIAAHRLDKIVTPSALFSDRAISRQLLDPAFRDVEEVGELLRGDIAICCGHSVTAPSHPANRFQVHALLFFGYFVVEAIIDGNRLAEFFLSIRFLFLFHYQTPAIGTRTIGLISQFVRLR